MTNFLKLTGAVHAIPTLAPVHDAPARVATSRKMTEIAAKYGLSAAQQLEPARVAIVEKLIAGRTVTLEEFESLTTGGTAQSDAAALARAFPSIARQTYR